jgi:hypothetical protein
MAKTSSERVTMWLLATVLLMASGQACLAETRELGNASSFRQLLSDGAKVVGSTEKTILLQSGVSIYRCEFADTTDDYFKVPADGSKLFAYKVRGCAPVGGQ